MTSAPGAAAPGSSAEVPPVAQAYPAQALDAKKEQRERLNGRSKPLRKPHVNLVVLGHLSAGKSTASGHLLALAPNGLDDKVIARARLEAEQAGKPEKQFAWCLDKLKAERVRGHTNEIALQKFDTPRITWTLIDAPGHPAFTKNMITGTSQADIALLVVAADGGFELGMAKDGQTREHALLAHTLGVSQVVVAVSKMDLVAWSRQRFEAIRAEVTSFLATVYGSADVPFVPISGFAGTNLVAPWRESDWYTGGSLLDVLDAVRVPERPLSRPLRIPLQDVYKVGGVGTVPVGRIESGVLKPGMRLRFAPAPSAGLEADVTSVELHHTQLDQAGPGDIVGFHVKIPAKDLKRGMVAWSATDDDAAGECQHFRAQLIVLEHPGEIRAGYAPHLDVHTAHVPCRVRRIECRMDRSGNVLEQHPEAIRAGDGAMVLVEPLKPVCVETFERFPPLGRFALRDKHTTVAVGVIKSVVRGSCRDSSRSASPATSRERERGRRSGRPPDRELRLKRESNSPP